MKDVRERRFALPKMEGVIARWYTTQRGSGTQLEAYRRQAAELGAGLPDGADVLEVAFGPGYHAIELARPGHLHVTGLDISSTFVGIAGENARRAGVDVTFRHGDVERMPFPEGSFDLIVCQAAFKNFGQPVRALDEMHRVLRPGGTAVIQDMNRNATPGEIDQEVRRMALGALNAFVVRRTLGALRLRAASAGRFTHLAAQSAFGTCEVRTDGITLEVRLTKAAD